MSYQPSREVFSKPKSVNAQLAEFVRKSPTCEYPAISYLSTEKYAGLISERVRNPWKINQKETYLCGPNAYLFCLATSHKEYYVKYMLDLWTFGEASIAGLYVKPSNSCLNFNVQLASESGDISAEDWVALASLRDSSNALFSYDAIKDGIAGISYPSDMLEWFRGSVYKSSSNHASISRRGDVQDLIRAQRAQRSNAFVCMLISAKVVQPKAAKVNALANHWAILSSDITVAGKSIDLVDMAYDELLEEELQFTIATWGYREGKLPVHQLYPRGMGAGNKLTVKDFLNYFYGYICAK